MSCLPLLTIIAGLVFDILHIPIHQENYYEPKSNLWSPNRQSILDLPAITKDDIDYYKIFTDVREKNDLKRYGIALDDEQS